MEQKIFKGRGKHEFEVIHKNLIQLWFGEAYPTFLLRDEDIIGLKEAIKYAEESA